MSIACGAGELEEPLGRGEAEARGQLVGADQIPRGGGQERAEGGHGAGEGGDAVKKRL